MVGHLEQLSYVGIFGLLVLIAFGLPLPEDVPLLATGVLARRGTILPSVGMAVAWTGLIVGDAIIYGMARRYGRAFVERPAFRTVLSPSRLATFERAFERWGGWALFFGRFVPGFRAAVFVASGLSRFPFPRFLAINAAACTLSVPLWVSVGWVFADRLEEVEAGVARTEHWLTLAGLVLVVVLMVFGAWRGWFVAGPAPDATRPGDR